MKPASALIPSVGKRFRLSYLFPHSELAPLVTDIENQISDARNIFPNKTEFTLLFRTAAKDIYECLHNDHQTGLGRNHGPFGTEIGRYDGYEIDKNLTFTTAFFFNSDSPMWALQPGDVSLIALDHPHREGTSSPWHQPRFWTSVSAS